VKKPAATDHEVHELIRDRWSPRAFSSEPVSDADLHSMLEAARWAASCFNEQPWRFLVARRDDEAEFARLLSCLVASNRSWAKGASALLLTVASTKLAHNDQPNRHALHDVGLATAQLSLQATALGLVVHPMAGFSAERARELYAIPEDFECVAAIALGHPADLSELSEDVRMREMAERLRRPQAEFAFTGTWGAPLPWELRHERPTQNWSMGPRMSRLP